MRTPLLPGALSNRQRRTRKTHRRILFHSATLASIIASLVMLVICCSHGPSPITFVSGADADSTTETESSMQTKTTANNDEDEDNDSSSDDDDHIGEEESESPPLSLNVIELNSRNFDSMVGDGNVWLIEFYTPWYVFFPALYRPLGCTTSSQRNFSGSLLVHFVGPWAFWKLTLVQFLLYFGRDIAWSLIIHCLVKV